MLTGQSALEGVSLLDAADHVERSAKPEICSTACLRDGSIDYPARRSGPLLAGRPETRGRP